MSADPTRRKFLAASTTASVIALCGCVTETTIRQSDEPTSTQEPTPTVRTLEPPDEKVRVDDVYVENFDGTEHRVTVQVRKRDGGETAVFDNEFTVPPRTGVRILDVGRQGTTYEIIASLDSNESIESIWDVETCEGTEAPKGNMDAGIRIRDSEVEVVKNDCDVVGVGMTWLSYVDYAEHVGREITTTTG